MTIFGAELSRLLKERKISGRTLASGAGTSRSAVDKALTGERRPSLAMVEKWLDWLQPPQAVRHRLLLALELDQTPIRVQALLGQYAMVRLSEGRSFSPSGISPAQFERLVRATRRLY